ncbi:alpha/beta fold hydrolase [Glutamicibacter sp. JL.03c]|uniref:alpha/beta fold hydrolase n=1 Tax=Glutamicibacter sp. JL.03c TaxID=2984842 RepID=UPI0021F6CE16|nr:alpha/beta fold hydrolase [Glutamicibacter sp. JL.03c]UYQ77779.1 alpha/beta fold hydrolase [Glutamicibacter sp. JL.03c]
MIPEANTRQALVFGASGLVGRHLIIALLAAGALVTAAVRSAESAAKTNAWLQRHGVEQQINCVIVDFESPEILAGGSTAFPHITEIHNCAGTYKFGMSAQQARSANVGIVEKLMDFATGLPALQHMVHISGYRVGGQDPALIPWAQDHRDRVYRKLGAYEASKVEADAIFQALGNERGIPWSIVNPATVIGHSATGESDQYIGLAGTIEQLWEGKAAALPAGDSIFLPVLTVDYLAEFMAAVAIAPEAIGQAYWLLDDNTAPLGQLLAEATRHLGAKVPKLRLPAGLIKVLPSRISKADPETLHFMSEDRYPTGPAIEFADRHGIRMHDVDASVKRWADYLAARRFGAATADSRRFIDVGGVKTFELGDREARRLLLPGLPVNADTWAKVAQGMGGRVVDLPGLGLSGAGGIADWDRWLKALLEGEPVDLIGHSIGSAAAMLAAGRFPDKVHSLTLITPFFLQEPANRAVKPRPLVRSFLRHATAAQLSARLTGSDAHSAALATSASDLKRSTAKAVAEHLAVASSPRWRAELRQLLERYEGPLRIVWGSDDPVLPSAIRRLESRTTVELHCLPAAGHHPQLTHEEALIDLLKQPAEFGSSQA